MKTTKKFLFYGFVLIGATLIVFGSCEKDDDDTNPVNDIDGNVYKTVKIGTQEWFAENLRTTKYNNGTAIPNITNGVEWSGLSIGAYVWYENSEATYKNAYGALYNWYAVNTGNLCPTGWHLPTDAEWLTLEIYLIANGFNYDGITTGNKIAKALASTTLWTLSTITGSVGNTDYPTKRNSTVFTALPGGKRFFDGTFATIERYGYWWSATGNDATNAWYRRLDYDQSGIYRYYDNKKFGFSVRCVRD